MRRNIFLLSAFIGASTLTMGIIVQPAYASSSFPDVPTDSIYANEIQYVKDNNIVSGWSDGTYKPDLLITRDQILKLIVASATNRFTTEQINSCMAQNFPNGQRVFSDIDSANKFVNYICVAKINKVVSGYSDGTYKPSQPVTYAQATKIIMRTIDTSINIPIDASLDNYVAVLTTKNLTPPTVKVNNQEITRAEAAYLIQIIRDKYVPLPAETPLIVNSADTQTFTPTIVPVSSGEIISPDRGYYKWRGTELIPQAAPSNNAYERYNWSDIETTKGNYNFDIIEQDIIEAQAENRRFSFRIRDLVDPKNAVATNEYAVPQYIISENLAWKHVNTYIPRWDNAKYQTYAKNFIQAVGKKYNNDPRIEWVEIGMFGQYGEWYIGAITYPINIPVPDDLAKRKVIDSFVSAFPDTRLIIMAKDYAEDQENYPSDPFGYAISLEKAGKVKLPMGWRVDCLGRKNYFDFQTNSHYYKAIWPIMKDRWQIAPIIAEYCTGTIDPTTALNDLKTYHLSLVGNGNIQKSTYAAFSQEIKDAYTLVGKTAGYRYVINKVNTPLKLIPGTTFSTSSTWTNVGIAPVYKQWDVYFQLQDTSGTVVWEGKSSTNLRTLFSNETGSKTFNDTFNLPSTVPTGSYKLVVIVKNAQNESLSTPKRIRLSLAISGKNSDGSYTLGTVTVAK